MIRTLATQTISANIPTVSTSFLLGLIVGMLLMARLLRR